MHGAQSFEFFGEICAGDTVIIDSKIVDIFQKKSGALDFCIEEMVVKNVEGETLAVLTQTFIMRH